ncbi:expressed unknown protein [Seminavis robusta]|uniref:Uncharacterized protein n=1 Tax=Seminavis robusta TaxID=568900 RepID=A0A9N8DTG9_9STRA|nr:expressed unknown protein [Seminavis robusta]|eukprot:Sro277_g106150.1 n/a (630) ;mRNA; r:4862-6909
MRHLLTDLRGNPIYVMSRAARLRTRFRHPHLPTLFYHVQNRAWNDVLLRAKSHPQEVTVQEDVSKNSPLHWACRLDPPVEVILALKKAARMVNAEGCTPLHIASSHLISEPALEALLECAAAQPAPTLHFDSYKSQHPTADLSRCGRAPIHYACLSFRGLALNAFQKLLEATLADGNVIVDDEYYSKRLLGLDDFFNEDEEAAVSPQQSFSSLEQPPGGRKKINAMTIRDASGQTPLGCLFKRYRERMKCVINTVDRLWREHADNPSKASLAAAISVHGELGELWQRARFILTRLTRERLNNEEGKGGEGDAHDEAKLYGGVLMDMNQPLSPGEIAVAKEAASWSAEQHNMAVWESAASLEREARDESPQRRDSSPKRFRIVHSSVGLIGYGCPPEMVRLAISIHPEQIKEMDEAGNLPIHIAATARSYLTTNCAGGNNDKSTLAAAAAAAVAASDEDSIVSEATGVLSFFSSATVAQTINAFDKVIKILLQHYPESAKIPQGKTGHLPLVMAVESGCRSWDDGIHTLLSAYPPALHNRKLVSLPLYANVLSMITDDNQSQSLYGGNSKKTSGVMSPRRATFRSPRKRANKSKRDKASRKLTTMFELLKVKPELLAATAGKRAGREAEA